MITFVRGALIDKKDDSVTVEVNGLGYQLYLSANSIAQLPELGNLVEFYTHLYMREDIIQLYGFTSPSEREMFLQLISVSKIGPKSALAALSAYSPIELRRAIVREDVELISSIPGIGKKTAQRLILELKEKITREETILAPGEDSKKQEVRSALINLGYSLAEANGALKEAEASNGSAEELLKKALQILAKSI